MMFLERLAEQKIEQAIARGELENLPGKGKPIAAAPGMEFIAPELRAAYRMLRNAGYLPEEVRVLREIEGVSNLLLVSQADSADRQATAARLRLLLRRLGEIRSEQLWMADAYCRRIVEKLAAAPLGGRTAK